MAHADFKISELSVNEKLDLMETLWEDLSKDSRQIVSPEWHNEVLQQRNEADSADWETAKKNMKDRLSCK